jgi:xanthine dehydrogenase/oxidase
VSGEAKYTGDMPLPADALHAALVTSSVPHGKLVSIDAAAALAMPGVAAFYSAKDVPGDHNVGPVFADEECFAREVVTCVGQPVGIVVAESHELAMRAAAAVKARPHASFMSTVACALEREGWHAFAAAPHRSQVLHTLLQ